MAPATPKERIVIVGGGIAALSAAWQLSRTPELRARYEVTVHQMGWRLGGKLTSGRNPDKGWRNEEHGLHVWFGFYDNAFALAREIYARWARPHGCPFDTWRDAFTAQSLTPIGERDGASGKWSAWPLNWPRNVDVPGTGGVGLSVWGVISELLSTIGALFETLADELRLEHGLPGLDLLPGLVPDRVESLLRWAVDKVAALRPHSPSAPRLLEDARALALAVATSDRDGDGIPDQVEVFAEATTTLLARFQGALRQALVVHPLELDTARNAACALDIAIAVVRGILDPAYGILEDGNLDRIDHLEFRDWLKASGADPRIVDDWSGVRALYDTAFQYTDGDTARPSFAAGAAARVVIRIGTQYKGTCLYLLRTGMGETIIAPLYEVLLDQGVRFEFFSKLVDTALSADGNVLTRLRFARQARTVGDAPYRPLVTVRGLRCWTIEPDWDQLVDGAAMKAAHVDWESHWNDWPVAGHVELEQGRDFDRCILGVAMGAFKPLNPEDRSLAQPLLDAKPALRTMVEQLPLVPSCGLQLWMDRSLDELGWTVGSPAMVAWAYPMDIWADMTPVIATEQWPLGLGPKTSHYLCGTLGTELYRRPAHETGTPALAKALLFEQVRTQLETVAGSVWPRATQPGDPDALDWSVLHAPATLAGLDRLRWQYLRANIEPTECCIGTPTDSVRYRIDPDQTGVINLVMCGAWTRTGINVSCVEGAVMSGMKAARAVTGEPLAIPGEDFMGPPVRRPTPGALPDWAAAAPPPPVPPLAPVPAPPPSPSPTPHTLPPTLPPTMTTEPAPMSHNDLPPYQETLGHGQQSVLPPGVVKSARIYVFAVPIDAQAAEDFVNQRLAGPTLGELEYKVLGNVMLCAFLDGAQLTSTAVEMGWLRDRECAISLLMAEKRRGEDEPKLVGYMPYIFVDSSIAMATGREIWGFPKEMGTITVPPRTGPADRFEATATLFDTFERTTEGTAQPVVTVERDPSVGPLATAWETLEDALQWISGQLTNEGGQLWHWDDGIELAIDAAELALRREARIVNLKQFRDAEFPSRACYQAIIHSLFEFSDFRGGGILPGTWRMTVADAQSHHLIDDLGLSGPEPDVLFGFWVEVDFRIPPGKAVWRAP